MSLLCEQDVKVLDEIAKEKIRRIRIDGYEIEGNTWNDLKNFLEKRKLGFPIFERIVIASRLATEKRCLERIEKEVDEELYWIDKADVAMDNPRVHLEAVRERLRKQSQSVRKVVKR